MQKKAVVNLIKYFVENNPEAFRSEAYLVAEDFARNGDQQLGSYVLSLLSDDKYTFVPQDDPALGEFLTKVPYPNTPLVIPEAISNDLEGILHAVGYQAGVNKFLFTGKPGTGKTESAKQLGRLLKREILVVRTERLIDSRLGQTAKNIDGLFQHINDLPYPDQVLILVDELDSLAMERTDARDLREMGRATTAFLKGLDALSPNIVLVATTNLLDSFDRALLRRFDTIIDFNRYSRDDLLEIAKVLADTMLDQCHIPERNTRLLKKIIALQDPVPYPGDLRNLIRSSIAFSDPDDHSDYLRRLFLRVRPDLQGNMDALKNRGFTVREIETLTQVSKSQVARKLHKEGTHA